MHDASEQGGRFLLTGREFAWDVISVPAGPTINVNSNDFLIRIDLGKGRWIRVERIVVLGREFPPGVDAVDPPFFVSVRRIDVRPRLDFVSQNFVIAVVQNLCSLEPYWRHPLNDAYRKSHNLPVTLFPESIEEQSLRETAHLRGESELRAIAEKDARLTQARCPHCGEPCPTYRVSCKHCQRSVR